MPEALLTCLRELEQQRQHWKDKTIHLDETKRNETFQIQATICLAYLPDWLAAWALACWVYPSILLVFSLTFKDYSLYSVVVLKLHHQSYNEQQI